MYKLALKIINIIARIFLFVIIAPIILVIAIMIISINIRYYDYGINKSKAKLPYDSYFSGKSISYDFYTVLYTHSGKFTTQSDALIYIDHMHRNIHDSNKEIVTRSSKIHFSRSILSKLLVNNIILEHKTLDGKIIPSENNFEYFIDCINTQRYECTYEQTYKNISLPKTLIETINIEFIDNGEKQIISKTYPIEYAWHYSLWDIIMGV